MSHRVTPSEGDIINAFGSAMTAAGYNPGHIKVDEAEFVRFDAPGDKRSRKNGFYKVKSGQYPVGWFGDWKTGEQIQWQFYEQSELSQKEWKAVQKEHRRLRAEAKVEREAVWAEKAEEARKIWDSSSPDVAGHPYLERKFIDTPKGLRLHIAHDGTQLVLVPMFLFDQNGVPKLVNLQYIAPDGSKRFMKGARVDSTFFSLRGSTEHPVGIMGEGVATGFTIWRATGLSVFMAFNSGNMVKMARELQQWRPSLDILIAGDDDASAPPDWAEKGNGRAWVNAGAKAAEKAAKICDGRWVLPKFAKGQSRSRTDFNDLESVEGLDAVNKQIWGALSAPETGDDGDPASAKLPDGVQDESWRSQLPRTSTNALDGGNVDGVALFIKHHRKLQGRVAFNLLSKEIEVDGASMQKHHIAEFRKIMHIDRFKARKEDVADEMEAEARRNQYDPLQEYIGSLDWDENPRVDNWLTKYVGAPDNEYTRAVGPKILIGAIARAMKPGCKLDTMPVFEGPQGIYKSTAIRYLFGEQFFIDDVSDFSSKDTFQLIQGAWVCEIAELAAMAKSEISEVKKFLSKQQDKFRAPYERAPLQIPRRAIFFGSVNPEAGGGYLRDPTGARRFWPIECGHIDLRAILRDRNQLWAEAAERYREGERWWLEGDRVIGLAEAEQRERQEQHPWAEPIENYIRMHSRSSITIAELLSDAVNLSVERRDTRSSRIVGGILRAMGWDSRSERIAGSVVQVFYPPLDVREASNDKA